MLSWPARGLVLVVAAIQLVIAVVEMFLWKHERVHRRLGYTLAEATKAAPIVLNAGLSNAFLGLGLVWAALVCVAGRPVALFLTVWVIVAGAVGAVTLKWTTLVIQTLPGLAAAVMVWLSR